MEIWLGSRVYWSFFWCGDRYLEMKTKKPSMTEVRIWMSPRWVEVDLIPLVVVVVVSHSSLRGASLGVGPSISKTK